MCGEQEHQRPGTPDCGGSPPRVRGTELIDVEPLGIQRITPACAGNRIRRLRGDLPVMDHPRVCGEQSVFSLVVRYHKGSPPRVRGTESAGAAQGGGRRITPACAGNSTKRSLFFVASEDHPRVCGEQCILLLFLPVCKGSPPRVRGTEYPASDLTDEKWITPACAGNSEDNVILAGHTRDHPRVCGEQRATGD